MSSGNLIIISSPSGAGKTSIVTRLLETNKQLEFSVSACTRERRPDETDGQDYYFLSADEFHTKVANNEFLEWEEVYGGLYYGTLKSEVESIWEKGLSVIFDIDVVGALNLKSKYPDQTLCIFIKPPSKEVLLKRLKKRSTEKDHDITERIQKATQEMEFESRFDQVVVNDKLEVAAEEAAALVDDYLRENSPA